MARTLKIGTRGSLLATTQSGHVKDWLAGHGYESELEIVTTHGDVNMSPVERIGVGVFTTALRDALAEGQCDIAVHSFKDLPTAPDERFVLIVPTRADVRDCLIARDGMSLEELPEGAVIGTGAPRRISQLKALRPDIKTLGLRGNIDSRMNRVSSGEMDAVILAYAGLSRVGKGDKASQVFDPEVFIPAPAQGALAVECRADDEEALAAIRSIACPIAFAEATAERAILARLQAGCTAPIAGHAVVEGDTISLTGAAVSLDGTLRLVATASGPVEQAESVGFEVADKLLEAGAAQVLD